MICRLIYTSQSASPMTYPQIRDMNEQAGRANALTNLSGLLVYGSRRFLQVLEGDRQRVTFTYHRILTDVRHRDLQLVDVSDIPTRQFPDWSMRLIVVDQARESATSKALLSYGLLENFDPSTLSSERIVGFLKALIGSSPPMIPASSGPAPTRAGAP